MKLKKYKNNTSELMKRKILLPTDFSENASRAIDFALELFKNDTCIFYFLNVYSVTSNILEILLNIEPGSERYENAKLNSENGLAELLSRYAFQQNGNPKHSFQTISTFNSTLNAIKMVVDEKDIEFIVMGTKGESKSITDVYGTTAIHVMEKVRNCPVLVVPKSAQLRLPKEIVFPTGFKTYFKKRELSHLIDLAKRAKASIRVLHVSYETQMNDKQLNNKQLLMEYLEDVNHSFHTLTNNSISAAIKCFVESRDSDMIAFINKKHVFFDSILTQPLVKEIGYDSKVPLLILHDLKN